MVTTQSVTCQPCRPWPRVSRTVSSTALKKAYGIEPSSTSSRKSTPGRSARARRAGRRWRGTGSGPSLYSTAAPEPDSRSMQIVVVSRKVTSSPNSSASVAWTTSFCTSPYRETAVSWRTSSWRRSMSGSCSASRVSARWSSPRSTPGPGTTTVSSVGGAKKRPYALRGSPIASPILMSVRPHSLAIRPAGTVSARTSPPWSKTPIAVTLPFWPPSPTRSRVRRVPENIRAYATFSPAGPRSTLKTVPETVRRAGAGPPSGSPPARQEFLDAGQCVHARARDGRAEADGVDRAWRVWAVRAVRTVVCDMAPPSTQAASRSSSWSARTSGAVGARPGVKRAGRTRLRSSPSARPQG